jgi:hypothetical protein
VKILGTFDEVSTVCNDNGMAMLWVDANLKNDFLKYAETLVDTTNKKMWIYDGSDTCSMMTYTDVFTVATQPCSDKVWVFCEYRKDRVIMVSIFLNL